MKRKEKKEIPEVGSESKLPVDWNFEENKDGGGKGVLVCRSDSGKQISHCGFLICI